MHFYLFNLSMEQFFQQFSFVYTKHKGSHKFESDPVVRSVLIGVELEYFVNLINFRGITVHCAFVSVSGPQIRSNTWPHIC